MLSVLESKRLWFTCIFVGLELAQLGFEILDHLAIAACLGFNCCLVFFENRDGFYCQVILEFDASDVCRSELSEFDPGLAVVLDEVASDVGAALFTADFNTVVSAFL